MWLGIIGLASLIALSTSFSIHIKITEQLQISQQVPTERSTQTRIPEGIIRAEWEEWKLEHGKSYRNQSEEGQRLEIFFGNKMAIAQHNARYHRGQETYLMKMNHLGDQVLARYKCL